MDEETECKATLKFCHYTVLLLSLESFCQVVWLNFVCVYGECTWGRKQNAFIVKYTLEKHEARNLESVDLKE